VSRYKDEVLCNVISMRATNLLLGKPWQFVKKKIKHDEFKNRYSLENDGRTYTLAPLKPKQVIKDELKLKQKATFESIQTKNHGKIMRKSENKTSLEL
jgi:hypothetical protein